MKRPLEWVIISLAFHVDRQLYTYTKTYTETYTYTQTFIHLLFLGLQECVNHDLVMPYTVLHEKDDQIVAQFMYTILLTPNGTSKLTGVKFDEGLVKSEMKLVNADVIALLETDVLSKRSKKWIKWS